MFAATKTHATHNATSFYTLLLIVALTLVGMSGLLAQMSTALPEALPALGGEAQQQTGHVAQGVAGPFTLSMPAVNVTVNVTEAWIRGQTWDFSTFTDAAGHFQLTAYPGSGGNVVIGAHYELANFVPGPFINLDQLQIGDQIVVTYQGHTYTYQVTRTLLVDPSDVSVVYPTPTETLTLITCYTYSASVQRYTQRYVLQASLVSVW